MSHGNEIADARSPHFSAPIANYKAEAKRNKRGVAVLRLQFRGIKSLEDFIQNEIAGTDMLAQSEWQVIGTTILIWDRT